MGMFTVYVGHLWLLWLVHPTKLGDFFPAFSTFLDIRINIIEFFQPIHPYSKHFAHCFSCCNARTGHSAI